MGNNSGDVALAKQHLSTVAEHITFSSAVSPYVDLAVLRGCDALVLGPSSLGWWAAWLAHLPAGHVIAPRHVVNPTLPLRHKLVKGFNQSDYYPPEWLLVANDPSDEPARAFRHRAASAQQVGRTHRDDGSNGAASTKRDRGAASRASALHHLPSVSTARNPSRRSKGLGRKQKHALPPTFWEALAAGVGLVFRWFSAAVVLIGVPAGTAGCCVYRLWRRIEL